MARIISITGTVDTTVIKANVTGTPGGAGDALAYTGASLSALLVNTSQTAGFEYKVNSGSWIFVGRGTGSRVAVNFKTDTLYIRQTAGDTTTTTVEISIDGIPNVNAVVGDASQKIAQFSDPSGALLNGPNGYVPLDGMPVTGATSITFDSAGRISVVTQVVAGVTLTQTYTYNTSSQIATMAFNNGTVTLTSTYSYDSFGRQNGVTVA